MKSQISNSKNILKLEGITKFYEKLKALDNVSITLGKGEIMGIIGADSAGKSTLTKIIGGLERPDEGNLFVSDTKVKLRSTQDARSFGIEVISYEDTLSPSLDVAQNIFIGRWPRKFWFFLDKKTMYNKARKLLDQIGIGHFSEKQQTKELSGGLRHVVSLARAISFNPTIIVFDEPMMHFSMNLGDHFITLMRQLKKQEITQIIATRRPKEALAICDRILVMRHGKVVGEFLTSQTSEAELAALMMDG